MWYRARVRGGVVVADTRRSPEVRALKNRTPKRVYAFVPGLRPDSNEKYATRDVCYSFFFVPYALRSLNLLRTHESRCFFSSTLRSLNVYYTLARDAVCTDVQCWDRWYRLIRMRESRQWYVPCTDYGLRTAFEKRIRDWFRPSGYNGRRRFRFGTIYLYS